MSIASAIPIINSSTKIAGLWLVIENRSNHTEASRAMEGLLKLRSLSLFHVSELLIAGEDESER